MKNVLDSQLKEFVSRLKRNTEVLPKSDTQRKVSIVMPLYNQVDYIERSIFSVLNQDYSNIELIIIDGGSTDGSIEIIKKYESYLAYWMTEPDEGQSDALNKGFEHATGEIFGWLNADDLYMPDAIERAVDALNKEKYKSVVFGDYLTIDKEDNIIKKEFAFDFSVGQFLYEGFHLNAQSMFWKKDVHFRFGKFDKSLHRTMDYDFILRIGLREGQKRFLRLPIPLGCFRRHEAQKTQGLDPTVTAEHHVIASKNNCNLKYTLLGYGMKRFYRIRRVWWYFKRAGVAYVAIKLLRKISKPSP